MQVASSAWPPSGGAQEALINAGSHATLWNITLTADSTTSNAGAQSASTKYMYFKPDGTVCDTYSTPGTTTGVQRPTASPSTSATPRARTSRNQYKVYVYPVTGMPRMVSSW